MASVTEVRRRQLGAARRAMMGLVVVLPIAYLGTHNVASASLLKTPVTTTVPPETTTTSTLPSAVTTLPEGCALPPQALAVFVGTVVDVDAANAVFSVKEIRAGSLEGYQENTNVEVRYGSDVKFLDVGTSYIVGVAPDPISSRLSSSVKDSADLFGGAEIAGSNTRCPVFEEAARTLTLDGRSINAGLFSQFFSEPWRIALAFLLPPFLVLVALFGVVWLRRGVGK